MSDIVKKAFMKINPFSRKYINKNLDITELIFKVMEQKGLTVVDLAKDLGKNESEVSEWLSGSHDLTLSDLVRIELALDVEIIKVNN